MDLEDEMGAGRGCYFHHGFKGVPQTSRVAQPEPVDEDLIIRKRDRHFDQCRMHGHSWGD